MPVYELLEGKGYEVKLAHPKETRIIARAKVKTDKVDSERLAHLLRSNLLPHILRAP
jgi:transposase